MPAHAPPTGKATSAKLAAFGARLRAHRRALRVSATTAAEAAGMARATLHRIERGEPSVTIGAYMSAIASIGLDLALVDRQAPPKTPRGTTGLLGLPGLPRQIAIADYPALRRIAWQLGDATTLTPREALALYERNWRHLDPGAMDEKERAFVRQLTLALGGARLLV